MMLRPFFTAATIACLILPARLPAQQQSSANEDERLEALARSNADFYLPKTTMSVGFRVLSAGANVNFRQLGNVPFKQTAALASEGAVNRVYDNGNVSTDALRVDEKDASGNQTSTPGGRYQTSVTNPDTGAITIVGDFLSYTAGLTRTWGYATPGQVTGTGYIAMSNYSAISNGAALSNQQGPSGGVEFQLNRLLSRPTRKLQWGMAAGVALNDINSKVGGSVLASLRAQTDYFSLNGRAAPADPYTGPSATDLTDINGNLVTPSGLETTTPISAVPNGALRTDTSVVGGTTVTGNWQVKGAYLMVRLGPSVRTQITTRLGVTASLGLAGAYSGTRYSAVESIPVPDIPGSSVSTVEENDKSRFLTGFYADLNLEWSANERTGLFGGVSAQKFDSYDQSVGGRTAHIDLGNAVGVRGGVSIKF